MKTYFLAFLLAFLLSFIFCRVLIPVLRKLKAGQNILVYVKEHQQKTGTPTMGGLGFIAAAILSAVFFIHRVERTVVICIVIGLSYMLIGFWDDFLKKMHKENLGLRAWQKFFFQIIVAVFAGVYCFREGLTVLHLPFWNRSFDITWWILPLSIFVFVATVNAVNLTDGLDGLAAGSSVPFFASMGILICLQEGNSSLAVICFCLTGALCAYLLFNASPASIFMGDTGSLALGAFSASIGVFSGNALYIAVIGFVFVLSVISVILQVIYYKVTKGKRIFLMAPIHHHFQEKGYSESKIAYAYFTITMLLGILCILRVIG